MQFTTNLRKMRTSLEGENAQYSLPLVDILETQGQLPLNEWVGKMMTVRYDQAIHCVETGRKIKRAFGEGFSYDAWLSSPLASPSIVNPELSRIHEGIALRNKEWEEAHHNKPHYVYLSRTSEVKVGVTRTLNVPSRWIDQGATEGIILSETPYRQLAGLMEVALKDVFADKTNWQKMLKNEVLEHESLLMWKNRAFDALPGMFESFFSDNDTITLISYPVISYPDKVRSLKLDSTPVFTKRLSGIKGQYLLFDDDSVFNVRSHAGYRVTLDFSKQD